jgi:hypothetical protein
VSSRVFHLPKRLHNFEGNILGKMESASEVGTYRGADKSLGRPGWKQATATEDFDVRISYL